MPRNKLPAVIVDWDSLRLDPNLHEWLVSRADRAQYILAVVSPEFEDYEYDPDCEYEFSAVIRNSGGLDNLDFKKQVVNFVHNSEFNLAAAIDFNEEVVAMFVDAGVLFTLDIDYSR